MSDVIDFPGDEDFSKPPFSTAKPKPKAKRPKTPQWLQPAEFPEDAASILKRNRISRKKFNRYAENLALFLLANGSADFAISMQAGIRSGNFKTMEMFAKMAGLIKNDSGVVVNLNQNLSLTQNLNNDRHFDSIVRQLDERDRKSRMEPVITVAAIEASDVAVIEDADVGVEAR